MNSLLSVSTWLVTGAIAAEFVLLRAIVQETQALTRTLLPERRKEEAGEHLLGTRIKPFRARMLDAPDDITVIDPRGKTSFLLFVEPSQAAPSGERAVGAVLHAFQRRYQSAAFLVCCGRREECRRFREQYRLTEGHDTAKVLLDEDRELMHVFSVHDCPTGIVIDETGRIAKVGNIESG